MRPATLALVVAVPGTLGRLLSRLQRALDPNAAHAMPPHIPLVAPFVAQPPLLPLERYCWRTGHELPSFWIELGELVLDAEAGIARLPVASGGEHLVALRTALLDPRYTGDAPETVEPHEITLRLAFRDELAITKYQEATSGPGYRTCLVERFELMAQYPDGSWYQRDFYTLDRTTATA